MPKKKPKNKVCPKCKSDDESLTIFGVASVQGIGRYFNGRFDVDDTAYDQFLFDDSSHVHCPCGWQGEVRELGEVNGPK